MEFTAIDVETANPNVSSICQIGAVRVKNFEIVDEWNTLINPQEAFAPVNIGIHGISEPNVSEAPIFPDVFRQLDSFIGNSVCITHGSFDQGAIEQAAVRHDLSQVNCSWLDTIKVVRRLWPDFSAKGYGLANICKEIGYEFSHHDALEDAKAAAFIMIIAIEESGRDLSFWLDRIRKPIKVHQANKAYPEQVTRTGKGNGALAGNVVVFTGSLNIVRSDAADMAAAVGCEVAPRVTQKTTMLVVGDQDLSVLAGHKKSTKHRKAEDLITKGQSIRILGETDFLAAINEQV